METKPVAGFLDFRNSGFRHRLYDEVILGIGQQFGADQLMTRIGQENSDPAIRKICAQFGREAMEKSIELGEKYEDRAYTLIKELAARSGTGPFPHVVQRYLEIAYLGMLPVKHLPILVGRRSKLTYRVAPCSIYESIKAAKGEKLAAGMPCTEVCSNLASTLFKRFDVTLRWKVDALMAKDGHCQFTAEK